MLLTRAVSVCGHPDLGTLEPRLGMADLKLVIWARVTNETLRLKTGPSNPGAVTWLVITRDVVSGEELRYRPTTLQAFTKKNAW